MVKRNKSLGLPTNKDDKIVSIDVDQSYGSVAPYTHTVGIASTRRTALDSRRPAKSNESSILQRWGDLDTATRTARRTVLNSTFWAEQIRAMA